MSLRGVNSYTILGRRAATNYNVAPEDFDLSLADSHAIARLPARALPYCIDLKRERLLFTGHDEVGFAQVRTAAFMFTEQLATAICVHSVPFERLPELSADQPPPLLVFSPGRTGSTLLMRVLSAAGLACASEPDLLTQLARFPDDDLRLLPSSTRQDLARAAVAALQRALGAPLCIKLRSQSNERPLLLPRATPGSRIVFMVRGMRAWALSRHRSFAESPHAVAAVLRQAMDAFDSLRVTENIIVLWFETLARDPERAVRLCAPNSLFDSQALRAVLAEDAQAGTIISRAAVADTAAQADFLVAFAQAWAEIRSGAQWHQETNIVVGEMWEKESKQSFFEKKDQKTFAP